MVVSHLINFAIDKEQERQELATFFPSPYRPHLGRQAILCYRLQLTTLDRIPDVDEVLLKASML